MSETNQERTCVTKLAEINKQHWRPFCSAYSRQHQGWRVNLYVYDPEFNHLQGGSLTPRLRAMVTDMPLQGIVLEEHGRHMELVVNLGPDEAAFAHRITSPSHISCAETDSGLHEGLLIHLENGGVFRIGFSEPAIPESVDGWMAV